ncbi:hypothetical protein QZH41_018174 [Actinostola sp. cb2023]|nr:hypothetical protein QZH41_018174 [Actinostola sp. cb2023]
MDVMILALLLCFASIPTVHSSKFLAIPYNSKSHYFAMKKIAEELAQRGHKTVLLAFETKEQEAKVHPNLNIVTCSGTNNIRLHENLATELLQKKAGLSEMMTSITEMNLKMCDCILSDNNVIKEFKSCDVMINDMSLVCGSVIHDLLGIPRVTFFSGLVPPTMHSWMYSIPMPLSYIFHIATGFTTKMSFLQRVGNLIHFPVVSVFLYFYFRSTSDTIRARYNITPERNHWDSESDTDLVLIQTDFAINYARPLPPGVIAIGPLSPEPAKPLPEELERFMDFHANPEGVVVVSFGTEAEAAVMGSNIMEKMMKAFGQLKQGVLWKLRGTPTIPIPQNIKVLPWIPQNDVLGHVNTKVFVTHVGHNGMFEAAYHSVPMVGIPLLFDQLDNARMMEAAGLGIAVDIHSITADELTAVIERVLRESSFSSNAARVSRLLKDRKRTPVQEAADHMEYVLRHGGTKHVRPAVLDIPWYQYFLFDVIIFVVATVTIVLAMVVFILRWLFGFCCKKVLKTKRE